MGPKGRRLGTGVGGDAGPRTQGSEWMWESQWWGWGAESRGGNMGSRVTNAGARGVDSGARMRIQGPRFCSLSAPQRACPQDMPRLPTALQAASVGGAVQRVVLNFLSCPTPAPASKSTSATPFPSGLWGASTLGFEAVAPVWPCEAGGAPLLSPVQHHVTLGPSRNIT